MGVLYTAQDPATGDEVAIKLIAHPPSPEELERFRREGAALTRLAHPGIVGVRHVGEHAGRPYVAMELLAGVSLGERLKRQGALPPREAVGVALAVAEALVYAHGQGIVHRDLKPDNVLLGADGRPRLVDFGLALALGEQDRLSRTGQTLGTPGYMSPEQANGDWRRIGPATDVYAVGATLFALLTAQPPFTTKGVLNSISAILEQPPRAPSELNPAVDPDLDDIVFRCLAKPPEERYPSAAALRDELAAYLRRGEQIRRPPPSPVLVGALSALGTLLVIGGVAAVAFAVGGGPDPAPPAEVPLEPEPRPDEADPQPGPPQPDPHQPPEPPSWYTRLQKTERPALPLPAGIDFGDGPGEYRNDRDGSVLVYVPPGSYPRVEIYGGTVTYTRGLFLGKYEVSAAQYRAFCQATGTRLPKELLEDEYPATHMTLDEARAYCAWAGLRLPSAAEWEFAARGPEGRAYPWGSESPSAERAVLPPASASPIDSHPAGASWVGCQHMVGNVLEWTQDGFSRQPVGDLRDPLPYAPSGPLLDRTWIARGGSFKWAADYGTEATQGFRLKITSRSDVGFRVARGEQESASRPAPPMTWEVRWFRWTKPPKAEGGDYPPPPFEELRAGARRGVQTEHPELVFALGYRKKGGTLAVVGPSGLPDAEPALREAKLGTSFYAFEATTEVQLEPGPWEVEVVSDDGVRVEANGEVALNQWGRSYHNVTHLGRFHVAGDRPTRLRVYHFQIDGYAMFRLRLRRPCLLPD
jgi:serine/threonine protein kinase